MYALKALMTSLGSRHDRQPSRPCRGIDPSGGRARPISSTRPLPASKQADVILIIGANPRKEAAVLNARIRKAWRAKAHAGSRRDRRPAPT